VYPDERWPYLVSPQGEHEAASNAASLARFREHMHARAREFVRANRSQLDAVAAELLKKGELDVEDLQLLHLDVQPAAGFERFTWPEDIPAERFADRAIAHAP
jgi:hypothetical protein